MDLTPGVRALGVVLALFMGTSALAAPLPYTATVLNLPGYSSSAAINDAGQVAVNTSGNALLYTPGVPGSGFTDLGALGTQGSMARAINDSGQVAGTSVSEVLNGVSYYHPFLYTPGTGMADIGGGRFALDHANDVNDAGVVVLDTGYFSASTGVVPLQTALPGLGDFNSRAISDPGVLVGAAGGDSFTAKHAAILGLSVDPLTGMTRTYTDLNTLGTGLPDAQHYSSQAYDINDRGLVVGSSRTPTGGNGDTAILSLGAGPMISLGGLPGRSQSVASSINNSDLIVGSAFGGAATHGFLYSDGMYDLNTLVTGSPFITDIAVDGGPDTINDWGQIAAYGTIAGQTRALILNPVNPLTPGIDHSQPGQVSRDTKFVAGMNYGQFTATTNDVAGSRGTTAELLDGFAGANRDVLVSIGEGGAFGGLASDVVGVTGTGGDVFVLQLSYDEALANQFFGGEANAFLSWLDPADQIWKNAVEGNTGGTPSAHTGAYDAGTDFVLGYYGVDTVANKVWAVLNHNSSFAIVGAPEPSQLCLALGGLLGAATLRLRRRD